MNRTVIHTCAHGVPLLAGCAECASEAGAAAFRAGRGEDANPHPAGDERTAWATGWLAAQRLDAAERDVIG